MSRASHEQVDTLIAAQLKRGDLTPTDVLDLTLARRLNNMSDSSLAEALGGKNDPPLNFWNRR